MVKKRITIEVDEYHHDFDFGLQAIEELDKVVITGEKSGMAFKHTIKIPSVAVVNVEDINTCTKDEGYQLACVNASQSCRKPIVTGHEKKIILANCPYNEGSKSQKIEIPKEESPWKRRDDELEKMKESPKEEKSLKKPSKDIYFCVFKVDDELTVACMAFKKFWDKNHHLDGDGSKLREAVREYGLVESMESVFESRVYAEGDSKDYHDYLVKCGFIYNGELGSDFEGEYRPDDVRCPKCGSVCTFKWQGKQIRQDCPEHGWVRWTPQKDYFISLADKKPVDTKSPYQYLTDVEDENEDEDEEDGEIVIIMGYPAAGKTTLVEEYVRKGYFRINRDDAGGSMLTQSFKARQVFKEGARIEDVDGEFMVSPQKRIVLDNTYPSRESRAGIIEVAKYLGVPIRCIWLKTSFEDAQLNACFRMIEKKGRVLMPEEFANQKDPNMFPPVAIFAYKKKFQKPTMTFEGFDSIEEVPFVRKYPSDYTNKALILDYDDTLRTSIGDRKWPEKVEDVEILPARAGKLHRYANDGYILLGASNQSAVAKDLPMETAIACFERTNELLEIDIDYAFCTHKIPPVKCFCRKPHPGIGAYFIHKYKLDPSKCIMVGDQTLDFTFAKRCGFKFTHAHDFF